MQNETNERFEECQCHKVDLQGYEGEYYVTSTGKVFSRGGKYARRS